MTTHVYLDHGLTIFQTHLSGPAQPDSSGFNPGLNPFITLSRETGAGATTLGRQLLPVLNGLMGHEGPEWMFLDKNLLTHILSKHHLPERLAEFLPEDRVSEIQGVIGELVGLHPSLWELQQQIQRAILQLAGAGRVIFTGRAAHLITRGLPGGLNVRLVAPMESRIRRMRELLQCDDAAAKAHILKTDLARSRYVKTLFNADISDPHTYDLVINTDRMSPATAAQLVINALRGKMAELSTATPRPAFFASAGPA
jgi:cytidylate kinase